MGTKILITGGTGLIGSHTAYKLAREGYDVVLFDLKPRNLDILDGVKEKISIFQGDVTSKKDLSDASDKAVEGIIHTAALPIENTCRENPITAFNVNVGGTLNVLEVARERKLKIINLSTYGVYGERKDLNPISEDDPLRPTGFYPTMKAMAEYLTEIYINTLGVDAIIIRTSWVYGPGLMTVQTPPSIFLNKILAGESLIMESGREHPLDLTYVKDLANGIFLAYVKKGYKKKIFNISGGKLHNLSEIADAIKNVIENAKIELGPGYSEILLKQAVIRGPGDITRAENDFGYKPQYSLKMGIKEYANWLKKQKYLS
jgi:nucleoside-diphosphate-sugar epimerase